MKELFEIINRKNINSSKNLAEYCSKGDIYYLIECLMESLVATGAKHQSDEEQKQSLFNFSASMTLSGSDYPCASYECRLNRINELVKFACLYADNVCIYNPFDFIYFYINDDRKKELTKYDELRIRNEAYIAFSIIQRLKTPLDRGIIKLSKTIERLCSEHAKKRDEQRDFIDIELDSISRKYIYPLIQTKVEMKYDGNSVHLKGMDGLIGEDLFFEYKKLPSYLMDKNGVKLTDINKIKYKNPLIRRIFDSAIDSLIFQKMLNIESLTRTYITNNELEKMLLERMGKEADNKTVNLMANNMPILNNIPYGYILDMREYYRDEYLSFQNKINELVSKAKDFEYQKEFDDYVEKELEESLLDLAKTQKEGAKRLVRKGAIQAAFLSATIAVATLSNYDIPSLLSIAQVIHGCDSIKTDKDKLERDIRKSPVYFYFKLKEFNKPQ